ncbi:hypothetical protein VFPFJ_00255 [Purpureocillium lilacinum]|uniref:Uncharacterized protein n=1 Tax=Purpureocillium lilacinum TaxID=33203 RepID=A0A179HUH6_PURLI|nr:hypothetical protein VFPFJ_00255 [Purpureocillium lilacinum]OAQ86188.1 hypothetical protein VFPBJ_00228 [Purpureocillium lilacinum]OAQ94146.1 hypothetical protein VFPFJ_00255 [Purpureocillium lilacinum]
MHGPLHRDSSRSPSPCTQAAPQAPCRSGWGNAGAASYRRTGHDRGPANETCRKDGSTGLSSASRVPSSIFMRANGPCLLHTEHSLCPPHRSEPLAANYPHRGLTCPEA